MARMLYMSRGMPDGRRWYWFARNTTWTAVHHEKCPCLVLLNLDVIHRQSLDELSRTEAHELLDQWLDELERLETQ
jgi:hypothetical protein